MGFLDKLNSIADRLGVRSDDYAPDGQQPSDSYQESYTPPNTQRPPDNRSSYQEPQAEPPQEQRYEYQQNAGGSGYTRAGVRPQNTAPKREKASFSLGGLLDRLRTPQQQQQQEYYEPQQPSNVIPMNAYEPQQAADPYASQRRQQPYAQAGHQQPLYQEEPESPKASKPSRHATTTMIYLVRRMNDAEEIIAHMLDGANVIVNMEEIDEVLKQRVLDMVSGAAFSLDFSVKRISFRNYLIAPGGEEIYSNITPEKDTAAAQGGFQPRDRRF